MLYSCHHREKDEMIVQKLEDFANQVSIHFLLECFIRLVFFSHGLLKCPILTLIIIAFCQSSFCCRHRMHYKDI